MNADTKPLIQQMKEDGCLQAIKEKPLRTYYTCVRYTTIAQLYSNDKHPHQIWSESGPWSCMNGWFETYDNTFRGKQIDSKVLDYCKFQDTAAALQKDIGETFTIAGPKN